MIDILRKHNNYKYICIKQQSPKIYEAEPDRIGERIDNLTITVGDSHKQLSIIERMTG